MDKTLKIHLESIARSAVKCIKENDLQKTKIIFYNSNVTNFNYLENLILNQNILPAGMKVFFDNSYIGRQSRGEFLEEEYTVDIEYFLNHGTKDH